MPTFALNYNTEHYKMDSKRTLLTDVELDVHELRCLMDSFAKTPTRSLSDLLKRSISRMHNHLDGLSEEVELVNIQDENIVIKEDKNDCMVCENMNESSIDESVNKKLEEPEIEKKKSKSLVDDNRSAVLGERLKLEAGLRQSISLNDSFRFAHELFGGDEKLMNRVIEQISVMNAYDSAVAFLSSKITIDKENESLNDFLELLKRYFN